jgi:hypothetical protein
LGWYASDVRNAGYIASWIELLKADNRGGESALLVLQHTVDFPWTNVSVDPTGEVVNTVGDGLLLYRFRLRERLLFPQVFPQRGNLEPYS